MINNENSLPMLFYILSIVVTIVGVFYGIVMMMDQKETGILVIIFTVINAIILYGISKVLQLLVDIKGKDLSIALTPTDNKLVNGSISVNDNKMESVSTSERPYNEPVEWTLTEKQRANIIEYYRQDNQKVAEKEILISPFKGYCVVKTNKFVDVIELVDDQPITLNREQVESFSALRQWIESSVFMKKK